jgi:hypothetical protein
MRVHMMQKQAERMTGFTGGVNDITMRKTIQMTISTMAVRTS